MAVVVPIISTFDAKGIDKAVRDFKKLETSGQRTSFALLNGNKAVNSLGRTFAKVGAIGGGLAVVLGGSLAKSASTLQESISKVQAVFGDASTEVVSWSKTTATKLGIAQSAALEAAGTYGNLFQAFGLTAENSKTMSVRLVELAADMASFNNVPVDDAILALRSGLSGETEPLKRFGVALNEVRLKEEALRLGLITTSKGTLPIAIKTQAAYSLILKDTAIQQGDVARTSGGLAFQTKSLGAQFDDLKSQIGTALLPVATNLAVFMNERLMPVFNEFATVIGTQGVGAAFKNLGGNILNAIPKLGSFADALLVIGTAIVILKGAVLGITVATALFNVTLLANPIGIAIAAVIAFAAILGALMIRFKAVREVVTTAFNIMLSVVEFFVNRAISAINMFIRAYNLIPFLDNAGTLDKVSLSFGKTGQAAQASASDFRKFEESQKSLLPNIGKVKTSLTNTGNAVSSLTDKAKAATDNFAKFESALGSANSATKSLADATKAVGKAQTDLSSATSKVAEAQAKLNQISKGYGASSSEAIGATKELARLQRDAIRAGFGLADAQQAVVDAQKKIADLNKPADARTIQEATDDVTEANFRLADAEAELVLARAGGKQREITEAEIAVRDATNDVTDANIKLADSQKLADPTALKEAQQDLADAELAVLDALEAQEQANIDVADAQKKLNELTNGASTSSDTYRDALKDLQDAQKDEVDALDNLREAKEREFEATNKLTKANLLLQQSRAKLTPAQLIQADKAVDDLTYKPSAPVSSVGGMDFSGIDFSGIDFSGIDFSGINIGGLATLASGGIVTKPTLALIGEGGESEAVIPLSQMGDMGGGDVYNITINSKIADQTLPDLLVAELRKFNRRSGAIDIQVA